MDRVVAYRGVECFQSLACQRPAAPVSHRHRYHHWYCGAVRERLQPLPINFHDSCQCGFDIEGIEACLDKQQIGTAFQQCLRLNAVGLFHLIKAVWPECRVSNVRRQRERLRCRSHASCYPYLSLQTHLGSDLLRLVSSLARYPCALERHTGRKILATVLRLRYGICAECICLYDIGPGRYIFLVYSLYDLRMGEIQALIVALQLLCTARERPVAVIFFRKSVSLDHSAHGSVQNQYPVILYVDHTFHRKIKLQRYAISVKYRTVIFVWRANV